ncbi:MAG: anti-sigma factor antagonist [Methylococcaceae bacterium]|nr:MAG: anti-sigma factor antagonist [Methylococcaceae bacterium]
MATETNTGTNHVAVEGALTIYTAASCKELWVAALNGADGLELDVSAVAEIDGAGLQLLIMIKREAAEQGKSLCIVGHSAPVLEVLDLCHLAGFFGDPLVIPSPTH